MNEISALIKEPPETSVTLSPTEGHSKEMAIYEAENRSSSDTESSVSGFWAS